jgi:hypothetical protein
MNAHETLERQLLASVGRGGAAPALAPTDPHPHHRSHWRSLPASPPLPCSCCKVPPSRPPHRGSPMTS